ncbi:hypothetical protein [Algoriphagus machipongonensis]|uniref:Uncharacterized protein n=1 Tax=Algoriphagus machipongonensis TaxID=388413 RepID=A3I0K6_9BACT|nr:hypothetical protein [Algoriphagus machipongonensis]EAZ80002.1 hypothetical protein ALPR1_15274 [Algoriphagus machipongonensis]
MNFSKSNLDLELWQNQELYKRQYRLKLHFWEILSEVASAIDPRELEKVLPSHKSYKLSRGNDLLGMPYQVLDILRNFDEEQGLNIRVLNWFGKGMYLMVLTGSQKTDICSKSLLKNDFLFGKTESPWDYPGLIIENLTTKNFQNDYINPHKLNVWIKHIKLEGDSEHVKKTISRNLMTTIRVLTNMEHSSI